MRAWLLAAMLAAVSVRLGSADTAAAATFSSALQRPSDADAAVEQGGGSTLTTGMSLAQVRQASARMQAPPVPSAACMREGCLTTCMQEQPLISSDGRCFLIAQPDGNLVLYSSSAYNMFGPVEGAAIWGSGSAGINSAAPYSLTMQAVRASSLQQAALAAARLM